MPKRTDRKPEAKSTARATAQTTRRLSTEAQSERTLRLWHVALIFFGLSLVYFLPALAPGRQMGGSDYIGGGLPIYRFIAEQLRSGHLPDWLPGLFTGVPIFANPGSTYFPVWLVAALLFSAETAFTLIFLVQFAVAGLGMYLLLRELGVRTPIALIGGIAYEFTGLLTSFVHAGHDGRLIVASLAPLVFYCFHRGIRTGAIWPFLGAAAGIGAAFLSFQIQSSYYLLVSALIWCIYLLFHFDVVKAPARLARTLVFGLGAVAIAYALAAVDFLPFLGYVEESPRGQGGRGYEFATSWSLPPEEISAFAVPEYKGFLETYTGRSPFKLHTEYLGAFVIVLLIAGAYAARRDRRWLFFGGLSLFGLSIALGGYTPIYRLYYALLPGTKLFRAPNIVLYVVSMSLTVMAALGFEWLARLRERVTTERQAAGEDGVRLRRIGNILIGIAIGVFVLAVFSAIAGGEPTAVFRTRGFFRFAVFAAAIAMAVWFWLRGGMRMWTTASIIALIVVVDLWVIGKQFFTTVPSTDQVFPADDVVAFLKSQPEPFRVWALPLQPAYGPSNNYLLLHGLDQIAGYHGNQLERVNWLLGRGQGQMVDYHNLLNGVPPIAEATNGTPNPTVLAISNVKYLISAYDIEGPTLRRVFSGAPMLYQGQQFQWSVYENTLAMPRAYVVGETVQAPDGDSALAAVLRPGFDYRRSVVIEGAEQTGLAGADLNATAQVTEYTPDRVVVQVNSPGNGILVLNDAFYKDWNVRVSGQPAELLRANYAYRGVRIGPGQSEVVFSFEPAGLKLGFLITVVTALLLIGAGVYQLVVWRRTDGTTAETPA